MTDAACGTLLHDGLRTPAAELVHEPDGSPHARGPGVPRVSPDAAPWRGWRGSRRPTPSPRPSPCRPASTGARFARRARGARRRRCRRVAQRRPRPRDHRLRRQRLAVPALRPRAPRLRPRRVGGPVVAPSSAGRAARRSPCGALSGLGVLVCWFPIRVLIWVVRDEVRGLFTGDDPRCAPARSSATSSSPPASACSARSSRCASPDMRRARRKLRAERARILLTTTTQSVVLRLDFWSYAGALAPNRHHWRPST